MPADDLNSEAETADRRLQEKHRGIRWRSGLVIAVLGAAVSVTAGLTADGNTFRVIAIMKSVAATAMLLIIWWLFFSRVPMRVRLGVFAGVICIVVVAGLALVQSFYFDGDMRPRFVFRWEQLPAERTADWLRQNAVSPPAIDSMAVASFEVTEDDWSRYCGPNGDRVVREQKPELLDWKTSPPKELWRHPIGEAWSSCAIVGTRLFTQEQRGPKECVTCYDAETGVELWRHEDTARYETAMGGIGPRATPTVTADALYALGATGILNCLHPVTGTVLWSRNIVEDSGGTVLEWGMSGSPLIDGDRVIVDAGGDQGRAVIACHKSTGAILWSSGNHKAGHTSPRIEHLAGQRQLLIFHGDGLQALQPDSGKLIWEYPWTNQYKINAAQPMVFGDRVFLSSGYDAGCVLVDASKLTDGRPQEVWSPNKSMKLKFNEAVQHGDYVYGLDDGILACVDIKTGERKWKGGRYRFGQVLLWEDLLLIQAEKGTVAIVEVNPEEFRECTRFEALSERTWNVPAVCRGRLYVRNANEIACFALLPSL